MKNAIIIHGRPDKEEYDDLAAPSPSNAHWLPWLQKRLLVQGILAQTPEMPEPYAPVYEKWLAVFEQFTIGEHTILVGHSRGASFLLRWLNEHPVQVGAVVLVAPSITPNPGVVTGFSEYHIDPALLSRVQSIALFYSTDDEEGILESVRLIQAALPGISSHEYTDKGHFTTGDGVSEFPELLELLTTEKN